MAWGGKTKGSSSGKTWLGLFLVILTGMETSSDEMGVGGRAATCPQELQIPREEGGEQQSTGSKSKRW